jgi:hypothetical protein
MSERINRFIVGSIVPRVLYRLEIPKETKDKARELREILRKNERLNLVTYFNHVSKFDPLLVAAVYNEIDPRHSRQLISPVSYSNTDEKHKGNKLMMKIVDSCGVKSVRIVQSYQANNENYSYKPKEVLETYKEWIGSLYEIKKGEKPVGCIISPEGHRSDTGVLEEGNNGIIHAGRILKPVIYIPVGIIFEKQPDRESWNIGKRITLTLGETYIQEKDDRSVTLDMLMYNLAEALPMRLRGKYSNKN